MLNNGTGNFRIVRMGVAALVLSIPLSAIPAPVQVHYTDREKFTDVGDNGRVTTDARRDALLAQLTRHIQERAASRIPPGSTLAVAITDVDTAGDFESWRGPRADRVRIVKDVYPPRIKLDFRLADAAGKIIAEGRRELTDLAFMVSLEYRNDLLRHEKKLLDEWIAREFSGQNQ